GQYVRVAPPGAAQLPPTVEILVLATHVDHAVDRAGSSEHLPARLEEAPAVQFRLGFARIAPVDRRICVELGVAHGDVDPWVRILTPRFEEQRLVLARLAKAARDDAPRRTGANDDV